MVGGNGFWFVEVEGQGWDIEVEKIGVVVTRLCSVVLRLVVEEMLPRVAGVRLGDGDDVEVAMAESFSMISSMVSISVACLQS